MAFLEPFSKGFHFWKKQARDWKVTVLRTSIDKFSYQMISPYLSIYIVALGATATELGFVNSTGMVMAGIISPFIGWLIDRRGPKNIYLSGIALLALSYLTYFLAFSWSMAIYAMIAYWVGFSISTQSCATICGTCLKNEDRATGMTICETAAAGVLGMAAPLIGAWLVAYFGGIGTAGIRPVFLFNFAITLLSWLLVVTQLSNNRLCAISHRSSGFFADFKEIIKSNPLLRRWLIISAVGNLPHGMVFPFFQVFAHKVKGADEFVLGLMVTAASLTSIILAIPLGKLADRLGRRRILFFTIPLFWSSNIVLVLSPNPIFLIIAGALQGFYWIGAPIAMAMERELVSPDRMGRWLGITRCTRLLINALLAVVAGLIWDKIGSAYVFLSFVAIDVLLRFPLLIMMPETLYTSHER